MQASVRRRYWRLPSSPNPTRPIIGAHLRPPPSTNLPPVSCAARYQEAFEALGTSLEQQGVTLDRVAPAAYRVWFAGGGGSLDLLNDETAMAAQLEGVERGAGEGYRCAGLQLLAGWLGWQVGGWVGGRVWG